MTVATLINRPCTIVRRTDTEPQLGPFDPLDVDEYGNALSTLVEIATVCEIQQRQIVSAESDEAQVSTTEWVGFFPSGTLLDTSDAIRVDDLGTFELIGAPAARRNPRTQTDSHVEVSLQLVAGAEDAVS